MVLALVATAALERRCATPGRATARVAAAEPDSDLDPDIHRGSVTELDYEGGSDDDFRDSQPSPTPSAPGEDEGGTPGLGRRASAGKRKVGGCGGWVQTPVGAAQGVPHLQRSDHCWNNC